MSVDSSRQPVARIFRGDVSKGVFYSDTPRDYPCEKSAQHFFLEEEEIKALTVKALEVDFAGTLGEDHNVAAEAVRRHVAETWMERNSVTTVTRDGEVLPDYCRYWTHDSKTAQTCAWL